MKFRNLLVLSILIAIGVPAYANDHCFGLHAPGPRLRLAKMAHASSVRYIGSWDQFEPAEDKYDFALADKIVQEAQSENLELVFTIQCDSKWACRLGNNNKAALPVTKASMPLKMTYWHNLLTHIVERYDGDGVNDMPGLSKPVKYWQIQNEWQSEWTGTNSEFHQILKQAYESIKAADGKAKVISPGLIATNLFALGDGFNDRGWIYWGLTDAQIKKNGKINKTFAQSFLKKHPESYNQAKDLFASNKNYFDILDVHLYLTDPYECQYSLKWIDHEMKTNKFSKPIWSLEFACPFYNFSKNEFAKNIVQSQIIGFYSGLERIYWSSLLPTLGWSENFLRLALASQNGVPNPEFLIYSTIANGVTKFTNLERIQTKPKVWLFKFSFATDKKLVWIGWSEQGKTDIAIDYKGPLQMMELKAPFDCNSIEKRAASNKNHTISLGENPVFVLVWKNR